MTEMILHHVFIPVPGSFDFVEMKLNRGAAHEHRK